MRDFAPLQGMINSSNCQKNDCPLLASLASCHCQGSWQGVPSSSNWLGWPGHLPPPSGTPLWGSLDRDCHTLFLLYLWVAHTQAQPKQKWCRKHCRNSAHCCCCTPTSHSPPLQFRSSGGEAMMTTLQQLSSLACFHLLRFSLAAAEKKSQGRKLPDQGAFAYSFLPHPMALEAGPTVRPVQLQPCPSIH